MPSPSGILVTDAAVRLEFAHGPLASRVTLRRADGMPVDVDAWVRGDSGPACFVGRPRGDRALRVGATPLSLLGDLEGAVVSCCRREPLVSMRIAIARLVPGPPGPLPRWSETARPLERLADDRWLRPALRGAELVRDRAARACPVAP